MLFVFDWDGTLLDSTGKILKCMKLAIDDVGLELLPDEVLVSIIGLGLNEAIQTLFPAITDDEIFRLKTAYSEHFIHADQTPCQFYPNAMEVLETLKLHGHTLTIATGKSRKGLDRVLSNLNMENFFAATRCADETQSKPHPQMLYELLEITGHSPEGAMMIGDTEFDMAMAQTANIRRMAVTYGAHPVERLEPYDLELVTDDLTELLVWLERQGI